MIGWIPVNEELPPKRDGERRRSVDVIIWRPGLSVGWYDFDYDRWFDADYYPQNSVTHWMLPPTPQVPHV